MALIKCPECDGTVSSNAYACPHCGLIITKDQNQSPDFPSRIVHQERPTTKDKPNGIATDTKLDSKKGGWAQALGVVVVFLVILGLNKVFPDLKLLEMFQPNRGLHTDQTLSVPPEEKAKDLVKKAFAEMEEKRRQLQSR